jgi:hypothetical protein
MRNHQIQALKKCLDTDINAIRPLVVRLSVAAEQANEQTGISRWAARMAAIRKARGALTDEDISLYECIALTSWESR